MPDATATALEHHSSRNHVVHRLAHAIYGLIVLAAVVGDLSSHDDDLRTAIVLVAGGAVVLVLVVLVLGPGAQPSSTKKAELSRTLDQPIVVRSLNWSLPGAETKPIRLGLRSSEPGRRGSDGAVEVPPVGWHRSIAGVSLDANATVKSECCWCTLARGGGIAAGARHAVCGCCVAGDAPARSLVRERLADQRPT